MVSVARQLRRFGIPDFFNGPFLSPDRHSLAPCESTPDATPGQHPIGETPPNHCNFLTFESFYDYYYELVKESLSCMDAAGRVIATRLRTQGGRLSA